MSCARMHARFLGSLLALMAAAIIARAQITVEAVCGSNFTWMVNSENQSPCLVAGHLAATCGNGKFNVGALTAGNQYDPPGTGSNKYPNVCSCSWASYNLFSACTLCQGIQDTGAMNWATYDQGCGGFLSDTTFFPANETIPSETSIPFWAGINPTTWQDGRFNVAQAQTFKNEGHSDYGSNSSTTATPTASATPSATSTSAKSTSSVGPIVGGVVGGLAALAIAGACAYFFLFRRRKGTDSQETFHLSGGLGHFRSMSDSTQKSSGNTGIQPLLAARASATSPISSYTHVPSLSGHSLVTTQGLAQPSTLQNRIEPFVGVMGNPELRKGATAARASAIGFDQVYEDHQQPQAADLTLEHPDPISFEQAEQATGTNPPPYVETSDPDRSESRVDEFGHRRLRGEMGSGDTFNTRTTGGGSGSSLAQMGIPRTSANPNFAGSASNRSLSIGQPPREADEPEL